MSAAVAALVVAVIAIWLAIPLDYPELTTRAPPGACHDDRDGGPAVRTHNENHPTNDHDCADLSQVEPRRYPCTDVLWASPECTNHSQAKGRKRNTDATPDLFGEAEQRRRSGRRSDRGTGTRLTEGH